MERKGLDLALRQHGKIDTVDLVGRSKLENWRPCNPCLGACCGTFIIKQGMLIADLAEAADSGSSLFNMPDIPISK